MEGWVCPRCGRCYSPFVHACGWCGPIAITAGTDWGYDYVQNDWVHTGEDKYVVNGKPKMKPQGRNSDA